jgi:hypothetical protein
LIELRIGGEKLPQIPKASRGMFNHNGLWIYGRKPIAKSMRSIIFAQLDLASAKVTIWAFSLIFLTAPCSAKISLLVHLI